MLILRGFAPTRQVEGCEFTPFLQFSQFTSHTGFENVSGRKATYFDISQLIHLPHHVKQLGRKKP